MQFHKARTSSFGSIAARIAVLGLLALALVAQSHATTIYLTMADSMSDYHSYTYYDLGIAYTLPTGPYPATLSGGSYGSGVGVFVMCYDINIDAYVKATYAGIMVLPTTEAEIEAAYLQKELADKGGFYGADVDTISGPISMAVWQLMDPSSQVPTPFALDPAAAAYVSQAEDAYSGGTWTQADAAKYAFWMPTPITATQRFGFVFGQAPQSSDISTPEPGSLVLMAAGFAVVLALRRKRQAPASF
jgi:hypothetical protein